MRQILLLSKCLTDLVDGKPPLHAVTIPFEAQLGISDKISDQLRGVTCGKAAISLVQSEGRVIVMKSDCWFNASGNEAIDLPNAQSVARC